MQLRDAVVPQRRQPAQRRATPTAPPSASSSSPPRRGPTTRAARRRRPPTAVSRARRTTTCTPTRTRTPPRPGSRRSARPATSPSSSASRRSATRPGPSPPRPRRRSRSSDARTPPQIRRRARPAQGPHGREPRRGRRRGARRRVHRRLLRLHQARAVHARLPGQGGLRVVELDPQELAGAHRGRERRQGRQGRAQARHATPPWSRWRSTKKGLPIHKDATFKIRPRIFLEGNFFVDVTPGTPSAPTHRRRRHDPDHPDGDAGAARPGADARCRATRATSLQKTLDGLGDRPELQAVRGAGRDADPSARGETAGQVAQRRDPLRRALAEGHRDRRRRASSAPSRPRPLARSIDGLSRDHRGPGAQRRARSRTSSPTSTRRWPRRHRRPANLSASIRLLGPTLQNADRALDSLNASFPNTRAFAREILPGVHETPATIDAAFPWIAQARALLGPAELQGVAAAAAAGHGDLAKVIDASLIAAAAGRPDGQVHHATSCCRPATSKIDDGALVERRRELQGVLVHDGRPRRRGPELRRQRHVRALPARRRRRRPSRWARRRDEHRQAVRQRDPQAAGHAARVSRASARPTSPTCPATSSTLPDLNGPAAGAAPPAGAAGAPARSRAAAAAQASCARRREAAGGARDEDRDPQARARLRRSSCAWSLVAALVGGYILVPPALLPARLGPGRRLGLRRLQGRVRHRAVGHAGPGPDGPDRRRRRWATSPRSTSSTGAPS